MIKVLTMTPLYVDCTVVEYLTWEEYLNVLDTSKELHIRKSKFHRPVVWVREYTT